MDLLVAVLFLLLLTHGTLHVSGPPSDLEPYIPVANKFTLVCDVFVNDVAHNGPNE